MSAEPPSTNLDEAATRGAAQRDAVHPSRSPAVERASRVARRTANGAAATRRGGAGRIFARNETNRIERERATTRARESRRAPTRSRAR